MNELTINTTDKTPSSDSDSSSQQAELSSKLKPEDKLRQITDKFPKRRPRLGRRQQTTIVTQQKQIQSDQTHIQFNPKIMSTPKKNNEEQREPRKSSKVLTFGENQYRTIPSRGAVIWSPN